MNQDYQLLSKDMITEVRQNGKAAEKYAEFKDKHVIIYYRDMRDTDRKLHGVITEAKGDALYLQNGEWSGVLNCRHAKIILLSTVAGWNKDIDTDDERGFLSRLFRRLFGR